MHRWTIWTLVTGLWMSGAAAVFAQGQEVFRWRGRVDRVDEIDICGDRVRIRHLEAEPIRQPDHRFTAPLPRRDDLNLRLRKIAGRGRVTLVEEPSAWNDYTATVLIEDDAPGADDYEFELGWRSDDRSDRENDDWNTSGDWNDTFNEGNQSGEGLFRWSGRVDIGADIEVRGDRHRIEDRGGSGTQERLARFGAPLPWRRTPVSLHKIRGRGEVVLIQSPDASNGYVAVVRIVDEDRGADDYEFELRWRN